MLAAKEMVVKQQGMTRKKQQLAFEVAQKKQQFALEEDNVKVETELTKAVARGRVFAAEMKPERDETKRKRGEANAMNEYIDTHLSKANVNDPNDNGFTRDTGPPREHACMRPNLSGI